MARNSALPFPVPEPAVLRVDRNDIDFYDIDGQQVCIEITVHNDGVLTSPPTQLKIEAAPLGAFVEWTPIAEVPVGPITPGASVRVRTVARRTSPPRSVDLEDVPPLAGTGTAGDGTRRKFPKKVGWGEVLPGVTDFRRLPPSVVDFTGRQGRWVGNINVFVEEKATERHRARGLRIIPARLNEILFFVGTGEDAYRFRIDREHADWNATLYDSSGSLSWNAEFTPPLPVEVPLGGWHPVEYRRIFLLVLEPPGHCTSGSVYVHVEQRSSGQTAVVELSFDPDAAGPGCYVAGT